MPKIDASRSDNIDASIRRLKRLNDKVGLSNRIREIQFYIKPTTRRRLAAIAARKRHLKTLIKRNSLNARAKQRTRAKKRGRGG